MYVSPPAGGNQLRVMELVPRVTWGARGAQTGDDTAHCTAALKSAWPWVVKVARLVSARKKPTLRAGASPTVMTAPDSYPKIVTRLRSVVRVAIFTAATAGFAQV